MWSCKVESALVVVPLVLAALSLQCSEGASTSKVETSTATTSLSCLCSLNSHPSSSVNELVLLARPSLYSLPLIPCLTKGVDVCHYHRLLDHHPRSSCMPWLKMQVILPLTQTHSSTNTHEVWPQSIPASLALSSTITATNQGLLQEP
jgi:hypothetical protein